jgi:hypothetical protein
MQPWGGGSSIPDANTLFEGRSRIPPRVVGGDEKGSLKSETVKYGREYLPTYLSIYLSTVLCWTVAAFSVS